MSPGPFLIAQIVFLALQATVLVVANRAGFGSAAFKWADRASTPLFVGNIACAALAFYAISQA